MATFPRRSSFPATNAASTFPRQAVVVTKEGFLSKRQRGRNSTDYKNLRFQRRYCVLSPSIFEYYENEKVLVMIRVMYQITISP